MKKDLDISPKPTFEIQAYRDLVHFCLTHGMKWSRYKLKKPDYITVSNLKFPHYSMSVPNKKVADRFIRWFNWMNNHASFAGQCR